MKVEVVKIPVTAWQGEPKYRALLEQLKTIGERKALKVIPDCKQLVFTQGIHRMARDMGVKVHTRTVAGETYIWITKPV